MLHFTVTLDGTTAHPPEVLGWYSVQLTDLYCMVAYYVIKKKNRYRGKKIANIHDDEDAPARARVLQFKFIQ